MKTIIGFLLVLAGAVAGVYFGLWWAFIGGIVVVVEQIRATNLDALTLALGIARVFFAAAIGWLSGLVMIVPGLAFIQSDK